MGQKIYFMLKIKCRKMKNGCKLKLKMFQNKRTKIQRNAKILEIFNPKSSILQKVKNSRPKWVSKFLTENQGTLCNFCIYLAQPKSQRFKSDYWLSQVLRFGSSNRRPSSRQIFEFFSENFLQIYLFWKWISKTRRFGSKCDIFAIFAT